MAIISDISKRVLIIQGFDDVRRISELYEMEDVIVRTKHLQGDLWEMELIKRVGDYHNRRKPSEK